MASARCGFARPSAEMTIRTAGIFEIPMILAKPIGSTDRPRGHARNRRDVDPRQIRNDSADIRQMRSSKCDRAGKVERQVWGPEYNQLKTAGSFEIEPVKQLVGSRQK